MKSLVLGLPSSGSEGHSPDRRPRRLMARLLALGAAGALALASMPATAIAKPPQPNIVLPPIHNNWPQFRHDATHTGYNLEWGLTPSNVGALGVAWTGATGDRIFSSPAVANGIVYVGSWDNKLYAYAVGCASGGGTCTPLWTATTGGLIESSPAVANGVVYVASGDGGLSAFDAAGVSGCGGSPKTCTPLWTAATGGSLPSSPTVANGVVYVASGSGGKLYAFDAVACKNAGGVCSPLWTHARNNSPIVSSPAVAYGYVYVGSYDGGLYAWPVDCGNCGPSMFDGTGGEIHSSPAVADGVVYVGSDDHYLYAFDATGHTNCLWSTCTPLWKASTGGYLDSSPAVADGVVYVGSNDGYLYAYPVGCRSDGGTCSPIWTGATNGAISSSPAVADGVVYVGSWDGNLYAFAVGCNSGGGSCSPLWTHTAGTFGNSIYSSPAVADGVVYVGSTDHRLYAFELNPPDHLALSPANATISAGGSQAYTAQGFDAHGNSLGDVTMGTTFTISGGGSCDLASCTSTVAGDHTVTGTWRGVTGTATLHVVGATYHALTPTRILDTRNGTGGLGVFSSHVAQSFQVAGQGGVPSGAIAVTGNLTVTQQTSLGYLAIGPIAQNNPTSSTLNFPVGDDRANAVTVALSGTGTLSVTYAAPTLGPTAQVIFDVTGYFTPDMSGATYHALTPTRILDSRNGTGGLGVFSSHVAQTFTVRGHGGVPANATAVTGNLTVTQQTSLGFLYMGPNAANNPTSSTLNFPVGDDRANAVTVALSGTGTLSVTYAAPTSGPTAQVIFDVTGYFTPDATGATYFPLTPTRILDSRNGTGGLGVFSSHVAQAFGVRGAGGVPANATAVTGNLTVTQQTSLGFLYMGPNAANNPTSSTLNFPLGDDRANAVTVALGTGGTLSVTYAASTLGPSAQVIFDVTGYFAP